MERKIIFGGDYNPEQWPEQSWHSDMRLMQEAGVNLVSLGVFSWALLQPSEDRYDFGWLDKVVDMLWKNGIGINMATATASQPAWVSVKYDDVLPVDENGVRLYHGSRQTYCPNSPNYRRLAITLTEEIVRRYGDHQAISMWHINNEYACHISACYCPRCAEAFRVWLRNRYKTIEALNGHWGTTFWSQYYWDWEEICPPRRSSAQRNPGQLLDYRRFMSDSILDLYLTEAEIVRKGSPKRRITTNFVMNFKDLDYFQWAQHTDVVAMDAYPNPAAGNHPAQGAIIYDLARSLRGGQPFILMEQAPSQVNWRPVNSNKRPGSMRLISYQALGHGADGIMFFQWRQARRGAEKFHSAMIGHNGDTSTRVHREICELGHELAGLGQIFGTQRNADVAIVFDYQSWWAMEYAPGPSVRMRYMDGIMEYYRPLYEHNIPIDFVPQNDQIMHYRVVIMPMLYMLRDGFADIVKKFVESGNTLVVGPFSGMVDESDALCPEGYLGPLRSILGVSVEEFDALEPHVSNSIARSRSDFDGLVPNGSFECREWCEAIHLRGSRELAHFEQDYHAGSPALTVNQHGSGFAYYLATRPNNAFMAAFLARVCRQYAIRPPLEVPSGVEVSVRHNGTSSYLVLLNHNDAQVTFPLRAAKTENLLHPGDNQKKMRRVTLAPRDCAILKVLSK